MLPVTVHLENGAPLELNNENLVAFDHSPVVLRRSLAELIFPGLYSWHFNRIVSGMPVRVTVRDPATGAQRQLRIRENYSQLCRMIAKPDRRAVHRGHTLSPA